MMERQDIGSGMPKVPLTPMGFDPKAYEAIQAKLDDVRKDLQVLQEDSEYNALIKKVSDERAAAKKKLAAEQEAKRQDVMANVDDVFNAYNAQFQSSFRKYKQAPAIETVAPVTPEAPAFIGNTQQVSFESKWTQPKDLADDRKKPEKKGWFRGLFGKQTAPAMEITSPKINQRVNITPEGKAMPQWAKVALTKAMEVDKKVLAQAKSESLGNPRVVPKKLTPSFAVAQTEAPVQKQPAQQEKKGIFAWIPSGARNAAKSAWNRLFG